MTGLGGHESLLRLAVRTLREPVRRNPAPQVRRRALARETA